eukprot:m.182570 g.182570  ORF g.182570 m.182570 type:complete len:107 (+) comp16642_c1_seq1:212-532(+)
MVLVSCLTTNLLSFLLDGEEILDLPQAQNAPILLVGNLEVRVDSRGESALRAPSSEVMVQYSAGSLRLPLEVQASSRCFHFGQSIKVSKQMNPLTAISAQQTKRRF